MKKMLNCEVVLLDAELLRSENQLFYFSNRVKPFLRFGNINDDFHNADDAKPKMICFVSDRKIRHTDTFVYAEGKNLSNSKRIEAATRGSLKYPLIGQKFIDLFVHSFNSDNQIKSVNLVMDNYVVELDSRVASDGNYEGTCPRCREYSHYMGTGPMYCKVCYDLKIVSGEVCINDCSENVNIDTQSIKMHTVDEVKINEAG